MTVLTRQQRINKFWSRVQITEALDCWEWQRSKGSPFGYGYFYLDGRTTTAHRVAWTVTYGAIPEGMCVLHKCDNPPCCNPNHLYVGTKADNARDKVERGRSMAGVKNANSKLTDDDVVAIRALLLETNRTYQSIDDEFGVTRQNIHLIKHYLAWYT